MWLEGHSYPLWLRSALLRLTFIKLGTLSHLCRRHRLQEACLLYCPLARRLHVHCSSIGLPLGQRFKLCYRIVPAVGERLMFAGDAFDLSHIYSCLTIIVGFIFKHYTWNYFYLCK